ncbi:MAG TPA: HAD family phosphatase [Azospirillaceae bacterium]|nr:HAD family phosphatase [Azospirillaceae bacterium]
MTPKALVFDLDGTLADTDPVHFETYRTLLRGHGMQIDEAFYRARISGRSNAAALADLFPHLNAAEHARIADEKEAAFRAAATAMVPLAGLVALLDWAEARGVKVALVTNAPRANAAHMLDVLGLAGRFPVQVLGEELPRAKPDPLPYVTALQRLGVAAGEAVAFEDSVPGIRSAVGAGIWTAGLTTGQTPETLLGAGAAIAIPDFTAEALWRRLEAR